MKGIIKIGASLHQDFASFRWPRCIPPLSEYKGVEHERTTLHPNARFDLEWNEYGQYWVCRRDGYGRGSFEYGNGPLKVMGWIAVKITDATPDEFRALKTQITAAERHYRDDRKHIMRKAREKQKDIERCMSRCKSLRIRIKQYENLGIS